MVPTLLHLCLSLVRVYCSHFRPKHLAQRRREVHGARWPLSPRALRGWQCLILGLRCRAVHAAARLARWPGLHDDRGAALADLVWAAEASFEDAAGESDTTIAYVDSSGDESL